jgi:hypothetical protein
MELQFASLAVIGLCVGGGRVVVVVGPRVVIGARVVVGLGVVILKVIINDDVYSDSNGILCITPPFS